MVGINVEQSQPSLSSDESDSEGSVIQNVIRLNRLDIGKQKLRKTKGNSNTAFLGAHCQTNEVLELRPFKRKQSRDWAI